jgi:hypothetical protein
MRQVTERLNFRAFDTVGLKSNWQAKRKAELTRGVQGKWQFITTNEAKFSTWRLKIRVIQGKPKLKGLPAIYTESYDEAETL